MKKEISTTEVNENTKIQAAHKKLAEMESLEFVGNRGKAVAKAEGSFTQSLEAMDLDDLVGKVHIHVPDIYRSEIIEPPPTEVCLNDLAALLKKFGVANVYRKDSGEGDDSRLVLVENPKHRQRLILFLDEMVSRFDEEYEHLPSLEIVDDSWGCAFTVAVSDVWQIMEKIESLLRMTLLKESINCNGCSCTVTAEDARRIANGGGRLFFPAPRITADEEQGEDFDIVVC